MNEATVAVALLANAIASASVLYRAGCWVDSPADMDASGLDGRAEIYRIAQDERAFWRGTGPELLCRWVGDTTGKIVTRRTIIAIAIEMSKSPHNWKMGLHECDN